MSITTYPGGKNGSGTYQQIINLIPPHDIFIEGFYGSGAITRNGTKKEILYMNYPKPEHLHDYTYIGDNYRQRERLQGIKKRMIKRFAGMTELKNYTPLSHMILFFYIFAGKQTKQCAQ